MGLDGIFEGLGPSATGLAAERLRLEVVATNIANAEVTRSGPSGEPYRRREVIFAPMLEGMLDKKAAGAARLPQIVEDKSPFPVVYRPGHPDADERGYVALPNVNLAFEMVDLATAARTYDANLSAIRAFREMAEHALSIGR